MLETGWKPDVRNYGSVDRFPGPKGPLINALLIYLTVIVAKA
jgi:hypothetical protein